MQNSRKETGMSSSQAPDQKGRPLVIVTGVADEIGETLVQALQDNYRVVACGKSVPATRSPCVDYVQMDQSDTASVQSALHQIRRHHGDSIYSAIDLSGYHDSARVADDSTRTLSEEATRRLMTGLLDFHVNQVVYISSTSVIEPARIGETVCEESPTISDEPFPEARLAAEEVVEELAGAASTVILRIGDVYNSRGWSTRLARQIARIAEKQAASYVFPGDVNAGQCRIHIDDLCDCLNRVIRRASHLQQRELFLITEPEVLSYAELQEILGQMIHGVAWPAIRIPQVVARAGAWVADHLQSTDARDRNLRWPLHQLNQHYVANVTRAETLLEWSPAHSFRSELSEIISVFRRDPQRWYEMHNIPLPDNPQDLTPVAEPETVHSAVSSP